MEAVGLVVAVVFTVWLAVNFGVWAIVGLVGVIAVIFIMGVKAQLEENRHEQERFELIALSILKTYTDPRTLKQINTDLMRSNPVRAEFLRNLQLMNQCIYQLGKTKKKDVGLTNLQGLRDLRDEFQQSSGDVVSRETWAEMLAYVDVQLANCRNAFTQNLVRGHIEKARSLKTQKARAKYLALAEQDLKDVAAKPAPELMAEVEAAKQELLLDGTDLPIAPPRSEQRVTIQSLESSTVRAEDHDLDRLARRQHQVADQWGRIRRTSSAMPYLLLTPGPDIVRCPTHDFGDDYEWIYEIDSSYWDEKPLADDPNCTCRIRQLSQRQADQILAEGITLPGEPELDDKGLPTGRRKRLVVPCRGIR